MILNFKEIPMANSSKGLQDTFELFARDFFEILGFEVTINPSRGSDGKMDLMIKESRKGLSGIREVKWLVSCKHFAHSGKSVSDNDEINILERVKRHKCHGFIGFYSTLPASSLSAMIVNLKDDIECMIFDRGKIESKLLGIEKGRSLAKRFFPESYNKFDPVVRRPLKLFKKKYSLTCDWCGRDLLKSKKQMLGIWVGLAEIEDKRKKHSKIQTHDAYFSCKGQCDFMLKSYHYAQGYMDRGWLEIGKFINPAGYLSELLDYIDRLDSYELHENAQEKIKLLFKVTYQYVARDLTAQEKNSLYDSLFQS